MQYIGGAGGLTVLTMLVLATIGIVVAGIW